MRTSFVAACAIAMTASAKQQWRHDFVDFMNEHGIEWYDTKYEKNMANHAKGFNPTIVDHEDRMRRAAEAHHATQARLVA